jgi:hypothetical protein
MGLKVGEGRETEGDRISSGCLDPLDSRYEMNLLNLINPSLAYTYSSII